MESVRKIQRILKMDRATEYRVIDDEMLREAIEEQGPQGMAGHLAKKEGIKYSEVTRLCLNYKNIYRIENLWEFTSLTHLQISYNHIEKIEGLENLTNLVSLDLSFNKIKVIEGLDTLVKLKELILSHNQISKIENMDTLVHLELLLLGHNLISEFDNIVYLRRFKKLRTLELAGNPISEHKHYKVFVAAHLPDLVYLDFTLIDKQTREEGEFQFMTELERLKQSELEEQKSTEAKKAMEDELQLHKDAFVEYLNGPHLFHSMFNDDDETSKLAHLPEVRDLLKSYQTQFEELCLKIFEEGLTQHTQRQEELECFSSGVREAIAENQQKGARIVAEFERSRRQMMAEMKQSKDPSVLQAKLRNEIMQIRDTLLNHEMQLVAQLEDITEDFDENITDMVGQFAEYVQGIFVQCRDVTTKHHEKVLMIAQTTLEKTAENKRNEDLPDDVQPGQDLETQHKAEAKLEKMTENEVEEKEVDEDSSNDVQLLFPDKDTMVSAVSTSLDTHLLKIDNREDELLTRLKDWKSELISSIEKDELKRNRKRIAEILKYVDFALDQLELKQKQT